MNALLGLLQSKPNPATEAYWLPFVEKQLPQTFRLLKDSHKSRFFNLIKTTFDLLHDLQFQCLSSNSRSIGIRHFITSQREIKIDEMKANHKKWVDREKQYLLNAGYIFETLTQEQKSIVLTTRKAVFQLIHEEQKSSKESDPFLPFISIWNKFGGRNAEYASQWASTQMKKFKDSHKERQGKNSEFIDKVEANFRAQLKDKKRSYESLTKEEQLLADAAKESILRALLQTLYNEPDTLLQDHSHLYDTALSYDKGSDSAYWENLEKIKTEAKAALLAQEKCQKYLQREKQLVQEITKSLPEALQNIAETTKNVVFQIIFEEQQEIGNSFPSLPFVSIYDHEGNLNLDYWIDLIDAKAKRNGERLPEKVYLKDCCDYDIMRILHSPTEDANTVGATGKRNGLITPEFCDEILENMKEFYRLTKKKIELKSSTPDLEQLKSVFQSNKLSRQEQTLCFQNEFCDVLSTLHCLQGDTAILLKRLNIPFKQSSSSNGLSEYTINIDFLSELEEECKTIQKSIKDEPRLSRPKSNLGEHADLIHAKMRNYSELLGMMGNQVERLGIILDYFSDSLTVPEISLSHSQTKLKLSSERCLRIQKIFKDIASVIANETQL